MSSSKRTASPVRRPGRPSKKSPTPEQMTKKKSLQKKNEESPLPEVRNPIDEVRVGNIIQSTAAISALDDALQVVRKDQFPHAYELLLQARRFRLQDIGAV